MLGLSDLMDMANAADAAHVPSPCFSDEDPEKERPCTKEEQDNDKANWESEQQASAETYCVANHLYEAEGVTRKLDWGIRYRDRFVCEDGLWRISSRELLLDWSQDLPVQAGGQ